MAAGAAAPDQNPGAAVPPRRLHPYRRAAASAPGPGGHARRARYPQVILVVEETGPAACPADQPPGRGYDP